MATGPAEAPGDAEFRRRLTREVDGWERDGLVSAEQAQSILRRYPPIAAEAPAAESVDPFSAGPDAPAGDAAERSTLVNRAVSIIGVMGAVLVGLGIIIYVAANWDAIPVWARVTMLVALTGATNVAGWVLLTKFDYPRIGVAVLVIGALAYGAAIHLVAQIYHVPVNHPNLTTAWFLGVLPVGYLARSRLMVGLSLLLLVVSMGFRAQWWLDFYGVETILFLAPITLTLCAAVCALGMLQSRFEWTRSLAVYCYYPSVVAACAAFGVMAVASIWIDTGNLGWAVLSAEYWVTAGVALVVASAATASLWRSFGDPAEGRPLAESVIVATMAVSAALMWLWLAHPSPGFWWLFNLAALGGVSAVGFLGRKTVLLGFAFAVFLVLAAIRFGSMVDFEGEAAPILLAAAALTVAAGILAASAALRAVPLVAPHAQYVAAAGLALAASSLHVMGYGNFWRWETPPGWSWMPVEYWVVIAVGWLLATIALAFVVWKRNLRESHNVIWEVGAVAGMAILTLAMFLGLRYQLSASWLIFNVALLAGIAALVWYAWRYRQLQVAYFACAIFALSVAVRCLAAMDILARDGLLLWLGPVGLGIGALVFLTGRLRARWVDISTPELRTGFRIWDLAGLSAAIISVYAMSYSDPWAVARAGTGGSVPAYLAEYWFLGATVWGTSIATLALIWIVDRMRLSPCPASPGQSVWETSGAAAMGAVALLSWLGLTLGWAWTWLPLNAALLCAVLALVAAGYRWNRGDLINLAVIAFGITLFTRYFEFGFGLLGQALAFIVAGAIMLVMGFGLEFLRRRMLRGVRPVEEPA